MGYSFDRSAWLGFMDGNECYMAYLVERIILTNPQQSDIITMMKYFEYQNI